MPHEVARDDDWSWVDDDSQDWVPPAVDTATASVARIYDVLLGGKDNFAVDRQATARLLLAVPDAAEAARANRDFLVRTVQEMARAGIDQFLDLGTGIPTSPSVHETARLVHPTAATVYVDNDPVVLAHNRALLARDPLVVTVAHDLREPGPVLADERVRAVLDLNRPIGLLMVAVLHFVDVTAAPLAVTRYVRELPPGSRVAITLASRDDVDPEAVRGAERVYDSASAPLVYRTGAQFEQLFDGLRLLPPGVHDLYRSPSARLLAGVAVR